MRVMAVWCLMVLCLVHPVVWGSSAVWPTFRHDAGTRSGVADLLGPPTDTSNPGNSLTYYAPQTQDDRGFLADGQWDSPVVDEESNLYFLGLTAGSDGYQAFVVGLALSSQVLWTAYPQVPPFTSFLSYSSPVLVPAPSRLLFVSGTAFTPSASPPDYTATLMAIDRSNGEILWSRQDPHTSQTGAVPVVDPSRTSVYWTQVTLQGETSMVVTRFNYTAPNPSAPAWWCAAPMPPPAFSSLQWAAPTLVDTTLIVPFFNIVYLIDLSKQTSSTCAGSVIGPFNVTGTSTRGLTTAVLSPDDQDVAFVGCGVHICKLSLSKATFSVMTVNSPSYLEATPLYLPADPSSSSSPPLIITGNAHGTVYAINAATSVVEWKKSFSTGGMVGGAVADPAGTVFVAVGPSLIALSRAGSSHWNVFYGAGFSGPVLNTGNRLCVKIVNGNLADAAAAQGGTDGDAASPGTRASSPFQFDDDDALVSGSLGLICLGGPSPSPTASPTSSPSVTPSYTASASASPSFFFPSPTASPSSSASVPPSYGPAAGSPSHGLTDVEIVLIVGGSCVVIFVLGCVVMSCVGKRKKSKDQQGVGMRPVGSTTTTGYEPPRVLPPPPTTLPTNAPVGGGKPRKTPKKDKKKKKKKTTTTTMAPGGAVGAVGGSGSGSGSGTGVIGWGVGAGDGSEKPKKTKKKKTKKKKAKQATPGDGTTVNLLSNRDW